MRKPCAACALKHVGQAWSRWVLRKIWAGAAGLVRSAVLLAQSRILQLEIKKGYAEHYFLAMGHMAEAEDELQAQYPDLAERVHAARKAWEMDPGAVPDFRAIILEISRASGYDLDIWLEEKETSGCSNQTP